jgi:hypothetical protein
MAHVLLLFLTVFSSTGCAFLQDTLGIGVSPGTSTAGPGGKRVLETGQRLAFEEARIFRGSCWGFVNAVYEEAGYPAAKRVTIFRRQGNGAYADPALLAPGDWVMHINLEYGNVDHSAIFIDWIDRENLIARTLDHAGMNRPEPGKYRDHSMAKVFLIQRAQD